MPLLATGATDWTSVAAIVAAAIALSGFLINALRGRRADDIDTIIKVNAELRADVDRLSHRVAELEGTLVKCQRENGTLRRRLART